MDPEIPSSEMIQAINSVLKHKIYIDPSQREYTDVSDLHPQRLLVVGPRQAMVDDDIREMIELLWKNHCETVLSCQGGPHQAGVVFASQYHGGLRFCTMLAQHQVPHESAEYEGELTSPQGTIPWRTVSVRFDPAQIPLITQLLRDGRLPRSNPAPAPIIRTPPSSAK